MKRTVKRLKSTKAAIEDLKPLLSLDLPLPEATRRFQAAYIKKQLARARGNMTDAAERLGLHRANLYRKMQQLSHAPERVTKTGAPRKKAAKKKTVTRNPSRKKKAAKKTTKKKTGPKTAVKKSATEKRMKRSTRPITKKKATKKTAKKKTSAAKAARKPR